VKAEQMSENFLEQLQSVPAGEEREWLVLQLSLRALPSVLQEAVQTSAVPHWFDLPFLANLIRCPAQEAQPIFESLTALSFVEPFPDQSYDVHQGTRALLLKRLWLDDQDWFRGVSARAAQYCAEQDQKDPDWQVEHVYHLLIASPHEGLQLLEEVGRAWRRVCAYDRVEALVRAAQEHAEAGRLSGLGVAVTKIWEANVHRDYSQYEQARDGYEKARRLFHDLNQDAREADALFGAGEVNHILDEYSAARDRYGDALGIYRKIGNKTGEARSTLALGDMDLVFGEFDAAKKRCEQARWIFHDIGDLENEAVATRSVGEVHQALGEYDIAAKNYEEGYQLSKAAGSRYGEARSLQDRASVHRALGEYKIARQCYDDALDIYRQAHARLGEAYCLEGMGSLQRDLRDYSSAQECYQNACTMFRGIGDRRGLASSLRGLGEARFGLGDLVTARQNFDEARQICQDIHDAQGEADCLLDLADLDRDMGNLSAAERGYRLTLDHYYATRRKPRIAAALRQLGRLRHLQGDLDDARSRLAEALDLFVAMGAAQTAQVEAELQALTAHRTL
jgi:tetratricopeptide (TPR) repeat protein